MQHKNELEVLVKNGTNSVYCIQYCYLIFDTWNYLNLFFSCKSRSLHLPIYQLIQYQLSKILFKSLVWNLEWNSTFIQSVRNKMQTQTPQWHFQNLLSKKKGDKQLLILVQYKSFNIWRPHKGHRWRIC